MSDYPSIRPEDVREGDVVRGDQRRAGRSWTTEGAVWITASGETALGESMLYSYNSLRLVSRPTPPEPPLRVGDFVALDPDEGVKTAQIIEFFDGFAVTDCPVGDPIWGLSRLTRIEPPVGWPVGVPDGDGRTVWYVRHDDDFPYALTGTRDSTHGFMSWPDLLAAGGVPALAVTR